MASAIPPGHWALALQKLPLVRFHLCAWVCRANGGSPNPAPPKPSPRGEGGWPPGQTDEGADFGPLVGAAPCGRSETPRLRFPCRDGCPHPPAVPPPHNLGPPPPKALSARGVPCLRLLPGERQRKTREKRHPRLCVDCQGILIGAPVKWGSRSRLPLSRGDGRRPEGIGRANMGTKCPS